MNILPETLYIPVHEFDEELFGEIDFTCVTMADAMALIDGHDDLIAIWALERNSDYSGIWTNATDLVVSAWWATNGFKFGPGDAGGIPQLVLDHCDTCQSAMGLGQSIDSWDEYKEGFGG